ncbi:MAG: type II secretion system protein GspN [Proteobacteria bacterium]|nr:type II secretion system protein GspN [Pseudomonadota bacterium]
MSKPKKSTLFLCVAVFIFGLIVFFPLQNLKGMIFQQIYQSTGILIVAEEIHPLLLGWPGIQINNVNVTLPAGGDDIELASKTLNVRARLGSSFIPSASLSFSELKGGGDLFLQFGQRGTVVSAAMESNAFNLAQIKLPGLHQRVEGILNSDISLKYNDALFSDTKGTIEMTGKSIKTPAILVNNPMLGPPFQIPELEAGDLDIKLKFNDGAMTISSFKLGNPKTDLSGSITGDAKLGLTPDQTQINLTLRLIFSQKILSNPEYKTFLDFLGAYRTGTAGEYAMNWNASIAEILNLTKALPTAVK